MATVYEIDHNTDIAGVVRILVRDATGVPTAGLSVAYTIRDSIGASLAAGTLTDLAGAPGWYVPGSLVLPSGVFTIEFTIPATFTGESDATVIVPDQSPARSTIQDVAFIDQAYRFNFLFTDRDNAPLAVTTPEIEIYHYVAGVRTVLTVANQPLSVLAPPETGRYTYVHTVATTSVDGEILYAEITATDPTPNGLGVIRFDYLLSLRSVVSDRLGTTFVP